MDFPETVASAVVSPSPPPYTTVNQNPLPSTPPPTYREAVGVPSLHLNAYPILSIPTGNTPVQHQRPVVVQSPLQQVTPGQRAAGTLGDAPSVIICPHCHCQITTRVYYKPGGAAWGMCCLLIVFGLCCGCCFIPCCLEEFQDVHHSCPSCKKSLGVHIR